MNQFDEEYERVEPRDLFHEALLLKCLGKLFLYYVDRRLDDRVQLYRTTGHGYVIGQDPSDATISCTNIRMLYRGEQALEPVELYLDHNSRSGYPLMFIYGQDDEQIEDYVFDDAGWLSEKFSELFGFIKRATPTHGS